MSRFVLSFLLISFAARVFGQSSTVGGLITDTSNASVADASIKVLNSKTGVVNETKSNGDGLFKTPPVEPGDYTLSVDAIGFGTAKVSNIRVEVGQSRNINVQLEAKQVSTSVTVEASAPELITDRAERGNVVESNFVENVPLNVRNPLQLINFAQGVVQNSSNLAGTNVASESLTNTFRINGNKGSTADILLDGATDTVAYSNEAADVPQVESVREFRVLTTAYSPEYGRTSGGIVSYAMQSGTNTVHGSAFEFLRNSVLDANGFNANKAGKDKAHFERNQFGYALGGPVVLPKLYNGKNRTFFFAAYEGLRDSAAGSYTGTVPTALERAGDFSQTRDVNGNLIVMYNPATTRLDPTAPAGTTRYIRDAFAGNVIPANMLNKTGSAILSYYPLPNQHGQGLSNTNNYFSSAPTVTNQNRVDLKVDHQINEKNSLFVRWNWFQNRNYYPDIYGNSLSPQYGDNRIPGFNWQVHHAYVISPSMVFEQFIAYGHNESNRVSPNLGFDPATLGIVSNAIGTDLQFPSTTASRIGGIGTSGGLEHDSGTTYQYQGTTSWLKGRHSIKFGADIREYRVKLAIAQNPIISANSNFTGGPNATTAASLSGSGAADLLLGAATYSNGYAPSLYAQHPYYAVFAQDEFHITPKLTFTYGLRYNLELPNNESQNQYIFLNLAARSPLASKVSAFPNLKGGINFVGTNGLGNRTQVAQVANFDPRAGLAYQIDSKTVFRAGFGIFHHPPGVTTSLEASAGYSALTTSNPTLANGVTPQFNLSNPFPNGLNPVTGNSLGLSTLLGQNITGPLRSQQISYSNQWSADIQRQLPFNFVVTVGYVGNSGVALYSPVNLNQLPDSALSLGSALTQTVSNPFYGIITDKTSPLSAATVQRGQLLRPFPQFQNVTASLLSTGHSSYQAMQLALERRFSNGFAVLFNYTHSKTIDNVGEAFIAAGPQNGFQDNNCYSCDRAVSVQNVPDSVRLSFNYELPFGIGKAMMSHGWGSRVVGGWSVGSFLTYNTGFPIAVTSPNNTNSFGSGNALRPNATGISDQVDGGPKMQDGGLYFNPAAFTRTPAYTFGNVSRNLPDVTTPAVYNWDLQVTKRFPITERVGLDFRTEFFNAFNRVQFAGPNTDITSSSFGRIFLSQANTPRNIQFGLRLGF